MYLDHKLVTLIEVPDKDLKMIIFSRSKYMFNCILRRRCFARFGFGSS